MRTSSSLSVVSALLLGLLASASSASPAQRQTALGPDGEIYRIQVGTYGQYFSAGLIPASNSVLVLEVRRPGNPYAVRHLVPGTETEEVELAPSLQFEESSDSVVVVWSSQWNYIHSRINLILFTDEEWSQPIELSGDVWSRKSFPAVAVTRDHYMAPGTEEPVQHQRAIYNVVWWEEAGQGNRVAYSPVVFVDGSYIGWNPVFLLTDLPDLEPDPLAVVNADLLESPTIQPAAASSAAVAAFIHSPSGRLVTMEFSAVAGELAYLAEQVRADLLAFVAAEPGTTVEALGERARGQIVDFGRRLGMHPGMLDFVSVQARNDIQQTGSAVGLVSLVERARGQIVDFGVRMTAQGLSGQEDRAPSWLVEFPSSDSGAEDEHLQSLRVRQVSTLPSPSVEASPASLFLSDSGESVIIAWPAEQEIRYLETVADGWSERRSLRLGEHLTAEQALELLAARVRNR